VKGSSEALHDRAKKEIDSLLNNITLPGVIVDYSYTTDYLLPVNNDPTLARSTYAIIRSLLGDDKLTVSHDMIPNFSEDFSFFQERIPGIIYFLGISNRSKGILGMPHHPKFMADEEAIFVGVETMSSVLTNYLETHSNTKELL